MSDGRTYLRRTNYTEENLASMYFIETGKNRSSDLIAFLEWCVENQYYIVAGQEAKEGKTD